MDGVNPTNSVLANLIFGIGDIKAQMEAIELMARETALKAQQAFQNTNPLSPINAQAMTAQQAKAQAVLAQGNAKIETTMAESANRQVLAREKADAAIVMSAAKSQAQIDEIRAREGINVAKSAAVQAQSRATIEAQNIKTLATVEKTEAQKAAVVAKGEAQISAIQAKEALTRQAIAQKEAATQIAITKQQVAEEKLLYMQARRAAFEEKPQGFAGLMERRASWLVTGGLVMGGIAGLAETVSTIKDVEMGMTVIARITEDATFNFKKMRDEVMQLGVEYGQTFDITSDIATRWAQAGYNIADTMKLTETALLAVNTAELDANYATQGLIAIMAQWNIEAENLLSIVDKINKTADDYAVSSQDLIDGLNRVGAAAKNAGLTVEETIGAITVLREASGRTGKEVGTALNTIFSYMTRNKTIDLMEALGIRVFEDEAKTTFRSIIVLMDELASRWQGVNASNPLMADLETELLESFNDEMATAVGLQEEWNDMQQRDISQAAAGVRRKNFFISLMSRFSEIQGVINGQLDAEGYSMRENERTMATLEKQIDSLKAAAEQLAVAIGDAGLLEGITGLVTGTREAIEWFNDLDDSTQMFIMTAIEATAVVKLLSLAFKGLAGSSAAAGLASLPVALRGIGGVVNVLKGVVGFLGGPVGIGITVAATALGVLYKKTKEAREELEKLPETIQSMQAQFGAIQGLQEEYDALSGKVSLTAEEKTKLADITAKLGEQFPEAIALLGEEGKAQALNNDILRESIRLKKEEISINQQKLADQFENFEKSAVGKEAQKNIEKIKELEKQIEESAKVMERYKELFGADGVISKGEQREIDLVRQSLAETSEELNKLNQEQLKAEQKFQQMAFSVLNTNDELKGLSDTLKNQLIKSIRDTSKDVFEAQKKIESLMLQDDLPAHIERMDVAFKDFNKTAKETKDIGELNQDFTAFRNEVISTGKEMGITGNQSVQLAYAIMETQDPTATAELKMHQLNDIVRQVGETGMASAQMAARASNILATNVSAATLKTIAAHWDDIRAIRDRAKAYEILAQAIYMEVTDGGLAVGMAGTSDTIRQRTREMQGYLDAAYALDKMLGSGGSGGSPPSIGGGGSSGSKGKEVDEIAEALKRLSESAKMFELVNMGIDSAMDAVTHKLNLANAEYDYLNSKVEAGTASSEDFARMQELLARKTALLNTEQAQLTSANRQYQQQIDTLTPVLAKATAEYERFRDAGDEEHMKDAASAVSSLRGEIDSLSSAITGNTQKIWENKGAMEQLATSAYAAYYQQTMAWMQHMEAIGRMNTVLQAEVLADIDKEQLARQDAWRLEEQQFQGRLDRLKEERDRIKDAYDARMRQYESEIEANDRLIESKEKQTQSAVNGIEEQIKAIQRLMDLLNDDAESEDREEAERQHNKKLAELAEERMYHVVRTGLDHQERIKEIDDEVAEEKRRWSLQQNQWAREDQKDAYQDQIDSLKERQKAIEKSAREEVNRLKQNNDRKKQEMQKYYNEVENLLNDTNLRMLAAMGNVNDQMYQKGLEMMRNFRRGMETGSQENVAGLSDFMNDVGNQYGDYVSGGSSSRPKESDYTGSQQRLVATISPNQVKNIGGTYTLPSRTLASLLGKSVEWNQQRQQVKVGSKWFSPLLNDNGTTYLSVRQVAESLGYIVKYIGSNDSVQIWDKAHDGAKVVRSGLAELRHDERVLSPQLTASFEKLASVLVRTPDITSRISGGGTADLNRVADRVIAAIERRRLLVDKAVNIEHASFDDRADMQALGVEIRSMLTASG